MQARNEEPLQKEVLDLGGFVGPSSFQKQEIGGAHDPMPQVPADDFLSSVPVTPDDPVVSEAASGLPGAMSPTAPAELPPALQQSSFLHILLKRLKNWFSPLALAEILWLIGFVFLVARALVQNVRFGQALRPIIPLQSEAVLAQLEQCRKVMKVRSSVTVLESEAVRSPVLYGLFQPKLLLPKGLIQTFSTDELQFIFLHELGHIKRCDMLVHWLMVLLKYLHWFNPLIWYARRRMQSDRELLVMRWFYQWRPPVRWLLMVRL